MSLVELFEAQGDTTDKLSHWYPHYYEDIFGDIKDKIDSFLEIGIAQGGSIRVWQQYFEYATIYALDIEPSFVRNLGEIDRVEASVLDVGNRVLLENWASEIQELDLVIDDGSHRLHDIITALSILWPKVTPGGGYIIEDAAQCNDNYNLRSKMADIAVNALTNQNEFASVEYWPNLIILSKKLVDDPRFPKTGTL